VKNARNGWRICGGDLRSGPRDECPDRLHDFPLPSGYVDASEAAERRMQRGWGNKRCARCGLYGWEPGRPTGDPCDEPVPAETISDKSKDDE
jgi:hypothetical protein